MEGHHHGRRHPHRWPTPPTPHTHSNAEVVPVTAHREPIGGVCGIQQYTPRCRKCNTVRAAADLIRSCPMTTAATIDKLELHAKRGEFRIHDKGSGLWHQERTVKRLTADAKPHAPWAVDAKGAELHGQLQTSVEVGHTILHISANTHGLRATINPNKVFHPFEPMPDAGKLWEVRQQLRDVLSKFADVDVDAMRTDRVDLCRQAALSEPVWKYAEALAKCKPPRKELFREPGGIRYGTARQRVQTAFYDLGKRASELDKIGGLPDNIGRLEPRFNKAPSVNANLGAGMLAHLLELGSDDLTAAYVRSVNAEVFRLMPATAPSVGQYVIPYAQTLEEIQTYFDAYGVRRTSARRWRCAIGSSGMLERLGSFDTYRRTLLQMGLERTAAWREAREAEEDWKLMPTAKRRASAVSYLRELQERFAA